MKQFKKLKINTKNRTKGFTLIELLIVIAIIGVLATLLMVNFVGVRQRARDAQRKSDLRQIQSALELYRSDQGVYPNAIPACNTTSLAVTGTTYMQTIPCDPLGGSYTYTSNGTTYSIVACLENLNDNQKDTSNNGTACTNVNTWSYTVQNP